MSFVIVRRIIWKLFYALTYINIMLAVHVLICVDITIIVTIHTIREETNYQIVVQALNGNGLECKKTR